jgi:hypothetical protein
MDDPESSFPPRSTPPQSVKDEPDDEDCFIMELAAPPATHLSQALAPPTEVPLRATQASKEMRKMMGVFRLNPFAIHSGAGRGVVPSSWYGGEAGPLEEDPLVFEFQLDIDGAEGPSSFSPGFERGAKDEGARPQWLEAEAEAEAEAPSQHPPPGSPTWDLPYVNDYGSASDSAGAPPPDYPPRRSGRLHSSA